MRKLAAILLVPLLATVMAACGGGADGSPNGLSSGNASQEVTSTQTSNESLSTGDSSTVGPDARSDEKNANLEFPASLTPEGAAVTATLSGLITLSSTQPIDELKAFYVKALKEAGVKKDSEQDIIGWTFVGKYDGDKDIFVSIVQDVQDSTKNTVIITY